MKEKEKIVWESKNKHIIIIKRKSFYENDDMIYVVYREKRDYKIFNSYRFYDLKWIMERWERSLEEAVNYAHSLPDEFIIEK